ncbi:MAG: restriction endonuclease subunit S [Nanoarchaeota archaeon]|nr:restriction endonuclease subunit S [Nanoarchaeota archaeon]
MMNDLPKGWKKVKLGDLVNIKHGFAFKGEYFSNSGPIVLTPGNFKEEGGLYFRDEKTKRYKGKFPDEFIFKNGDLIVVMTDLSSLCKILGNPAFINSEETILHNQRIGKIEFKTKEIFDRFL